MEFSFVKPILTLLSSQAFRDLWLKWKLDESLKRNLESYVNVIVAVLNYADDVQIEDPRIKDWLEDVKDALYDAEDLLDEISTSNSASETQSGSPSKVTNSPLDWARRVKKYLKKPIQFKKKEIINTLNPFGEPMDDRIKSMVERLKTFSEQKDILKLEATDAKKRSEINRRLTTPAIDEGSHFYGRDQDKEKIIKLLDQIEGGDNNRVSVIVMYGMGGLGKTTLAQIVYNDIRKRAEMEVDSANFNFDVQAWACVSDIFDLKKTTKDLLESATGKPYGDNDNLALLQDALSKELRDKRFLLVLDDIWTHEREDWEDLSILFSVGGHGSKIIVTTRDANVITSIEHPVIPHELRTLGEDDCWLLFERIAFPNGNSSDFEKLKAIGKQIVRKCKGLPLAAKTIAGLLRLKQKDEEQWEDVLNSSTWDSPSQKYLPALILSYRHLPVEERQCFAYCSMFPKDYKFRTEELVLLWIAEGFVSNAHENLEATGRDYFSNLLSLSFFQQFGDRESSLYVMHDLIHDLAQFVSGKAYLRKDEANEEDNNKSTNKTRRFSFVREYYDGFMKFKPISEVKCLRTFLPFGDSIIYPRYYLTNKVPNQLLPQMKFLRVLSLRGYCSVCQMPDSVGDLKHLRYLDLSSTKIGSLPDTINGLHNLQTLLLDDCSNLTRLSANVEGLVKLRHLRLNNAKLTQMPAGMEKMLHLRTLSNFFIGKENGSGISVLEKLSNLLGKVHISGLSNVVKATDANDANFQQKKNLKEVILDWRDVSSSPRNFNVEEEFMRKLRFHKNLTKLTIGGYGGKKFPEWIENLTKLVYVHIYDCRYCESLPSLGNLSCLKDLIIKGLDCIKSVDEVFYGNDDPFPSLETLEFKDMKDLEAWYPLADQEKGFRQLRELSIDACPKLPKLSHRFMSLKILKIKNCGSLAAFSSSYDCLSLESLEIEGCKKLLWFEKLRKLSLLESNEELFGSVIDLGSIACRSVDAISGLSFLPREFMYQATEVEELEMSGSKAIAKMSSDQVGPPQLVSLEELEIGSSRELLDLPVEMFPNLKNVVFHKCLHLQKLPGQLSRLQSLRELTLKECSYLVSFPAGGLPSMLKQLRITECPRLEIIPEGVLSNSNLLEDIDISNCSSLASFDGKLPTSLKRLQIEFCLSLRSLPQGLMSLVLLKICRCSSLASFPTTGSVSGGDLPMTLESLRIYNCDKLRSLPQSLPNLSSLRELMVQSCPLIEHFPDDGISTTNLRVLAIFDCPKVQRFPDGIHRISSLERLTIVGCPCLDSLPQLPRGLKELIVTRCERLGPLKDWGLDGLESLDRFYFGDIPSLEFLENKYLLPKTISQLSLYDLPNLKSMSNGLKNLTSLRELWITNCVKLESLPSLPETLDHLLIRNCPLLKRRCEKRGADWSKIADLPYFKYYDDVQDACRQVGA